jgi:hypothetical protein
MEAAMRIENSHWICSRLDGRKFAAVSVGDPADVGQAVGDLRKASIRFAVVHGCLVRSDSTPEFDRQW